MESARQEAALQRERTQVDDLEAKLEDQRAQLVAAEACEARRNSASISTRAPPVSQDPTEEINRLAQELEQQRSQYDETTAKVEDLTSKLNTAQAKVRTHEGTRWPPMLPLITEMTYRAYP